MYTDSIAMSIISFSIEFMVAITPSNCTLTERKAGLTITASSTNFDSKKSFFNFSSLDIHRTKLFSICIGECCMI